MTRSERWKPITDWENLYEISDAGRVKSLRTGQVKIPDINNCGYARVILCDGSRRKRRFIHQLVAAAFCDGFFNGATVNHIDGDKQNNRFENLEWVTHSENSKHAHRIGHQPGSFKKKPYLLRFFSGEICPFECVTDCARFLGVSRTTLYNRLRDSQGFLPRFGAELVPASEEST